MQRIEATKLIDPLPIYTMWLREMKRFLRVKARLISSILMPLLFLAFLGLPLSSIPAVGIKGIPEGINYLDFLAPGIVAMTLLFTATMSGVSVVWDKEFGFLKEVLVAPVNRFSIILGRSLGGMTTAIIQALIIVVIAVAMGVTISSISGFFLSIVFMILTCTTFTGFGLILATKLGSTEAFMAIMPLIVFPIFFLSGALFPLESMPAGIRYIMYIDPLTYGVDGLRGSLVGGAAFPLWLDFTVLLVVSIVLASLGAYFFSKMEAD
ncbi:MAG: multidrug ABC transporter permease [Dehalococcoidia bacterium]|nr:MAG: multidrug ABC transporter permease [Dehalococcoidia bacterium]